MGRPGPHLIHGSFGPSKSSPQTPSLSVHTFLQGHRTWTVQLNSPCAPHATHVSLGPPESANQTASWSVQPFLHSSRQRVAILYNEPPRFLLRVSLTNLNPHLKRHFDWFSRFCTGHHRVSLYLQWAAPSPLKIAPSHGGYGTHLIHGSLGSSESSTQTASRSVQLLHYCDRPTDHATRSVTIGHIYIRSAAMQPNNNNMHISLPSSEAMAAQVMSLLSDIVDQTRCLKPIRILSTGGF